MDRIIGESLYLLTHCYGYGENKEFKELKVIGVFDSKNKAALIIEELMTIRGFDQYSRDCFQIKEMEIDEI